MVTILNKAAHTHFFSDDGIIPNSPLPVIVYKGVVVDTRRATVEAELAELVGRNKWELVWTWRIYKFTHWHSTAHEGLICIQGRALIHLGGPRVGRRIEISQGDVVVLPAGVAHRNINAADDFAVCGIYPDGQSWDLIKGANTYNAAARKRVRHVPFPLSDPIYGGKGEMMRSWKIFR